MTNLFAESVVLEGDKALTWADRDVRCVVSHEDAGGRCGRTAVMEVYGLAFCGVHGAEAKAGALEELYYDASNFLERLENDCVPAPNPAALGALREAAGKLRDSESAAHGGEGDDAAVRQAYPVIPHRVDGGTTDFDYGDPGRSTSPPPTLPGSLVTMVPVAEPAPRLACHELPPTVSRSFDHAARPVSAVVVRRMGEHAWAFADSP